jgi:hypothetical protein
MYEVILPNAVPAAVREYNAQIANLGELVLATTSSGVDWSDSGTDATHEVNRLFEDEPRHGEVEDLMNALGATAACVRKVQS